MFEKLGKWVAEVTGSAGKNRNLAFINQLMQLQENGIKVTWQGKKDYSEETVTLELTAQRELFGYSVDKFAIQSDGSRERLAFWDFSGDGKILSLVKYGIVNPEEGFVSLKEDSRKQDEFVLLSDSVKRNSLAFLSIPSTREFSRAA